MAKQTENGKAFEYATLSLIYETLSVKQPVSILENSSLLVAKTAFLNLSDQQRINNLLAAKAALRILLKLEPQLLNSHGNEPLILSLQEDSRGQQGDVRDLLTIRLQNNWEIGISCKHNHTAVKHSRLSETNNFAESWFGYSCTKDYFKEIKPIFQELQTMKEQGILWKNVPNKQERFYKTTLLAFIDEINRLNALHPNTIPALLVKYLVGSHDFYKVITENKRRITHVHCFSLYGTLNRPSGNVKPQLEFKNLTLPTRFLDISFMRDKNNVEKLNTIVVTCDKGWQISMRIHSAETNVTPSLKFDVNLVGHPSNLYATYEPWDF